MKRLFESTGQKLRVLLLFNVLASILYTATYGFTIVDISIVLLLYFLTMCLGMVITFHRYYSHKSFTFKNNTLKYICTFLGLLSGSGSVFGWCAVHNKHHAKHDTEEDPHDTSKGLLKLLTLDYDYNIDSKYVRYLFKDKFLMYTHKYYYILILTYVGILYSLFSIQGVIVGFSLPSALTVLAEGLTTYFLHKDGKPRCVKWINWLVFGDGNHSEHHKDVKQYKLKHGDLSGWLIKNVLKGV
tara:strand:- start:182 stop:907 length:726 start_codon:yes stop_codon:yes gene_type:complete